MKKRMLKDLVSMLVIGLLVVTFVSVYTSVEAEETIVIKGTVVSINTDTGEVAVEDESSNIVKLIAGADTDLTTYGVGDQVTIESTNEGIIKSINKT